MLSDLHNEPIINWVNGKLQGYNAENLPLSFEGDRVSLCSKRPIHSNFR